MRSDESYYQEAMYHLTDKDDRFKEDPVYFTINWVIPSDTTQEEFCKLHSLPDQVVYVFDSFEYDIFPSNKTDVLYPADVHRFHNYPVAKILSARWGHKASHLS